MQFTPCNGNCTEDGTHCEGCGRSHDEVRKTRMLIGQVAQLAHQVGYENFEEFTQFVAAKAAGKVRMLKAEE